LEGARVSANHPFLSASNGARVFLEDIPESPIDDFQRAVLEEVTLGSRVASLFADPTGKAGEATLYVVLADDPNGRLWLGRTHVTGGAFPSLTPACPQAHLFEREIVEQTGLRCEGHPWLKPVRFANHPLTPEAADQRSDIGVMDFHRVGGGEAHEVSVGPIHAGIIEPGHFRFQCHGETILHLEISLGYQHRGIEEALFKGPHASSIHQVEALAGDSTVAHAWAYCQNLEALGGMEIGARESVLRALALELERVANHTGDLGALAGDVGYLPTQAYCGRIRGDFLNMTATLCGNRFGRGLLRPGGDRHDLTDQAVQDLRGRLVQAEKDVQGALELLWNSPSVMERFDGTGTLTAEQAVELGLVGPPARACGLEVDCRQNQPFGPYRFMVVPVALAPEGDVASRAFVRRVEIERSILFLQERLSALPAPAPRKPLPKPKAKSLVVSLIEGWRGEVCHVALTDAHGAFRRYKVTDPSFHNWMGLAMAMRGADISDFPVCNKSFNLSYCGFDL